MNIGVVGLGLMGTAFVDRLSHAGMVVSGHDVDPQRAEACPGRFHASVAELVDCHSVVLALFDTDQVERVTSGPGGLLDAWAGMAGRTIICTSTCDPERMAELACICSVRDVGFIELPISGTSMQVRRGEGVGLAAGEAALCERHATLLRTLCPVVHYLGDVGNGNRAKLAVNLVLGLNRAALAEGVAFGQRIGLDPHRLLEVLQGSAAASSVMPVKGPAMTHRTYEPPQSRVDQSLKDFTLIQTLATGQGQSLPMAGTYIELLRRCIDMGMGQYDNAAILEAILQPVHQPPGRSFGP